MENEVNNYSVAVAQARRTVQTEAIAYVYREGARVLVGAAAPAAGPYLHIDVAGGEFWGEGAGCACQFLRAAKKAAKKA